MFVNCRCEKKQQIKKIVFFSNTFFILNTILVINKFSNKIAILIALNLTILFLMGTSFNSYGNLSATTANTIIGNEPRFTAILGENKLGFSVQGTDYSEQAGNIFSGATKEFDENLTFNDFRIKTLTAMDFDVSTDYADDDNDDVHSTTPFTFGSISYTWKDNKGTLIPTNEYSNTISCNGYAKPLKLEIMVDNVRTHSQYGNPSDSIPITLTKVYEISSPSKICYIKPFSMAWYSGFESGKEGLSNPKPDPVFGGGYTADFTPNKGFTPSAAIKFPTTGFSGAQFQLIMSNLQLDYEYTVISNPGGNVSIDPIGNVRLNSKPTGAVTVRAKLKSNPNIFHDYTFNPTTIWVVPKEGKMSWLSSQQICGGGVTRRELTNSPFINAPMNSYLKDINSYTRAIGGGILGEWGTLSNNIYPGSLWVVDSWYWTSELNIDYNDPLRKEQFLVGSRYGNVGSGTDIDSTTGELTYRYLVCRG